MDRSGMPIATLPQSCPTCESSLRIERLRCGRCQTTVEGNIAVPRLARLSREDQRLIELFVLSSGSLKNVSKKLGLSYPTVRKLLDRLVETVENEIQKDEKYREEIVRDAKDGRISLESAKDKLEKT